MYGLVNQAIKDLVLSQFGEEAWTKMAKEAGVSEVDFVSMHYYEDKLTYSLVAAGSKVLGLPSEKILAAFGKYWIQYTANEGYGAIMDLFGADFKSCLKNLNNLHARMGMTMPQLTPPRFIFREVSETVYHLEYESQRVGLLPMVEGLLEGLAERYKLNVRVELLVLENEPDRRIFKIEILR